MPRNGNGVYTLPANSWNPAVSGTTIESSSNNATMNDLASAMTQSISKDGQTTWTGNDDHGNNKIVNLAPGTLSTDAANVGQIAVLSGVYAVLSGPNIFTADQTITSATAGSATGPNLILRRTASGVASGFIGSWQIYGKDSGGNDTLYGDITGQITDPTDGSEDSQFFISTHVAGAYTNTVQLGAQSRFVDLSSSGTAVFATASVASGLVVGAASGGNLGRGFINVASGVAINGTPITGKVIGLYSGTYSSNTDLTANIPTGSTPASGDGTQIISISSVVTTTSTQKVRIWFSGTSGIVAAAGLIVPTVAVFRGTTFVGAESGTAIGGSAGAPVIGSLSLNKDDSPGSAGTYTYSARVGLDTGTMRMNGSTTAAFSGRTTNMLIEVYEP